jgi:cell division protein ZapD
LILYEYPLNERVRTLLRLERLFIRLLGMLERTDPVDHHYALVTTFEIVDVSSRADLKSDLLKDLERQRGVLAGYRGNPAISEAALDEVLQEIEQAFNGLNSVAGKAAQSLLENDWLMSIRSRVSIPGGTCEFDLPSYFTWQQLPAEHRQMDLKRWVAPLFPLFAAIRLLLRLLRDNGVMQKVQATAGLFQQNLGTKTFQLMRLRIDGATGLVPEITGHRLMVSVRYMQPDADFRTKASIADVPFEIALCA